MGLIAHYRLDGDIKDSVGESHGTTTDPLSWVESKFGLCLDLNNSGVIIMPVVGISRHQFSLSFWARPTGNPTSNFKRYIKLYDDNGFDFHQMDMRETTAPRLFHYTRDHEGSTWATSSFHSTSDFNQQRWQHFTCVFESTGEFLTYTDGVYVNKATLSPNREFYTDYIGGLEINGSSNVNLELCDVRMYDHALSRKEIHDLSLGLVAEYGPFDNEPTAIDTSGRSYQEAIVNSQVSTDFINGRLGYLFNKTGGGINTQRLLNFKKTDHFTVCFPIRIKDHSSRSSAAAGIVGKGHWYDNTWDVHLSNSNQIKFECSGDATRNGYVIIATPQLTVDQTYFYTVTYREGTITAYLDGEVMDVRSYNGVGDFTNSYAARIGIRYMDTSRILDGVLGKVKIFATALTQEQVKHQYRQTVALDRKGNLHTKVLSEKVPYLSPLSSSQVTFAGNGYNNTSGESDPCSGPMTFEQALQHAYEHGGRLPTIDEMKNDATSGSGCNYDHELCWTCDRGVDDSEHWVVRGSSQYTDPPILRKNTETAYVRFVSDNALDRPDPVTVNSSVIKEWLHS